MLALVIENCCAPAWPVYYKITKVVLFVGWPEDWYECASVACYWRTVWHGGCAETSLYPQDWSHRYMPIHVHLLTSCEFLSLSLKTSVLLVFSCFPNLPIRALLFKGLVGCNFFPYNCLKLNARYCFPRSGWMHLSVHTCRHRHAWKKVKNMKSLLHLGAFSGPSSSCEPRSSQHKYIHVQFGVLTSFIEESCQ